MGQIKVYGHEAFLSGMKSALSDVIHECTVKVLGLPEAKRFHRFIELKQDDFIHPDDRSEQYLIIEISLISGRTVDTKKSYIRELIRSLNEQCHIPVNDIEITLIESPKENWGIRGVTADELKLGYTIDQ